MAPTYDTPGIIIGRLNLGEADRLLTIVTPEHGRIKVAANGVRKHTSRKSGHLELFSRTQLMLRPGKGLDTVQSAELIAHPHALLADQARLDVAFVMARLLDRLSPEGEAHPELYALAQELLEALDGPTDPAVLELGFKLRLLDALGYRPELDGCTNCGQNDPEGTYYLHPEVGGLVDASCAVTGGEPLPVPAIKLWRLALGAPLTELAKIRDAGTLARSTMNQLDAFFEYHFGRSIR